MDLKIFPSGFISKYGKFLYYVHINKLFTRDKHYNLNLVSSMDKEDLDQFKAISSIPSASLTRALSRITRPS